MFACPSDGLSTGGTAAAEEELKQSLREAEARKKKNQKIHAWLLSKEEGQERAARIAEGGAKAKNEGRVDDGEVRKVRIKKQRQALEERFMQLTNELDKMGACQ